MDSKGVYLSRIFLKFFPKYSTMVAEKFQIYSVKITGKYWICSSQVLINSIIFATFTFLIYVLLWNNFASSMLKCEGSLT